MSEEEKDGSNPRRSLSELLREEAARLEEIRDGLREDVHKLRAHGEALKQQHKEHAGLLTKLSPVKEFLEERGLSHFDELDDAQKESLEIQLNLLQEATRKGKTEIEIQ